MERESTFRLSETLKIAGIVQFSPPTVSSQTQYHSMIDGTLELVAGSLLDVDYHTNIASKIKISGDSTIDVAPDMTLTYSGDAIDVNTYQLTFIGTGTLLNSNAVLLSNSEGLIVFALFRLIPKIYTSSIYVCSGAPSNSLICSFSI